MPRSVSRHQIPSLQLWNDMRVNLIEEKKSNSGEHKRQHLKYITNLLRDRVVLIEFGPCHMREGHETGVHSHQFHAEFEHPSNLEGPPPAVTSAIPDF